MARAPQKINSYVLIDFETGGLDKKNRLHSQNYPITEVAALAIDGVNLDEIVRYDNLVKPYDNKLIYDPEAARATGITRAMCERDGVGLREVVNDLCKVFDEANLYRSKTARPLLVAHNWNFDRQFLQDIFRRAQVDLSKYVSGEVDHYGNFIPDGIDTIMLCKMLQAQVTDKDTKFKLQDCCYRAGVDFVDGHRAMNDVVPMTDLFRYLATRLRSGSSQVVVDQGRISVHRQSFEW